MSTLGAQEAIVTAAPGEWELIGRDMIRTKRTADGGGMVVAQFWTSPAPEHAALMATAPELYDALADTLRILEAVKLSAGLGPKQVARMDVAKAALAKAGA